MIQLRDKYISFPQGGGYRKDGLITTIKRTCFHYWLVFWSKNNDRHKFYLKHIAKRPKQ